MPAICSHCGLSAEPDAPVDRDEWWLTPHYAQYRGERLVLTPARSELLYAIAAARGPISREALLNRISYSEQRNTLEVQLSHLRRHLRDQGAPIPFEGLRGTGKIVWLDCGQSHFNTYTQERQRDHGAR
jgi:DNA-binding response OmpR family regulator